MILKKVYEFFKNMYSKNIREFEKSSKFLSFLINFKYVHNFKNVWEFENLF